MKKVIVILAFAALIIVFGLEKVVFGIEEAVDWGKDVVERSFFTAKLGELKKKDDVYYEKKTQEPYSGPYLKSYSGKFIDTYRNNAIKEKGTLKEGKRDGEIKVYREDGSIEKIETFEDNALNGKCEAYYENGNLMHTGHYKNGEP